MLEPCDTVQESLLPPRELRRGAGIARHRALPPDLRESQLSKFLRAGNIFGSSFVVDCQLLAGMNSILRIGRDGLPDFRGALVFAAPFRHVGEIAACLGTKLRWQPGAQGLRASGVRSVGFASPLEKSR